MTLFEAYVTNLGKYNEGELVGEYLKFPTTPEEVQALLKRIGIDGVLTGMCWGCTTTWVNMRTSMSSTIWPA